MAKKPVRVFLDSNVILSGLLSDTGAPRLILDILSIELPRLAAITGRFNIIELERNIRKKVPRALPVYEEYFPKLHIEIVPLPTPAEAAKHRGIVAEKDTPVLASALKGRADFLVTGDKKHFDRVKKAGTFPFKIMNPAEFLEVLAAFVQEEQE